MDLDFSLRKLPYSGDISVLTGNLAIKESVKNLLTTKLGERIFNPLIGTNIEKYLFAIVDYTIADRITLEITEVLRNFEPRIILNQVEILEEDDGVKIIVEITYTIRENNLVETLTKVLERDY
jgi:uncharacterized protein